MNSREVDQIVVKGNALYYGVVGGIYHRDFGQTCVHEAFVQSSLVTPYYAMTVNDANFCHLCFPRKQPVHDV